jgi:pimeloyl-ACP methyl ester carboxylesterase
MRTAGESVEIDGLRMHFVRCGSGPALVLVHGLLGYSFSWRKAVPLFSIKREVFAVDMPGSGFSDCSPQLDANLHSAAMRLLKFLDAMQIDNCDLVGSSYGGSTALMLASMHPRRVRTLILVSPANPWSRIGRWRLGFLRVPIIARCFPPVARFLRPLHGYFVRRMYGDPRRVTQETIAGYSRPLVRPGVFEHALKIAHSWRSNMLELAAALSPTSAPPTMIVWGGKDRLVTPASADILSRKLGDAPVVVMPGAGHLPYEECPEDFERVVTDFLSKHGPAQGLHGK